MSTLTAPAAPGHGSASPGLARTVLRLHRPALVAWTGFVLLVVGLLVLLVEAGADRARADLHSCVGIDTFCPADHYLVDYDFLLSRIGALAVVALWAVAAWAGGALTARELETGTARLAWTQSCTPARWLAAKLALPALALTAGAAVITAVFRWAWTSQRDLVYDDWGATATFLARGPALAAYALCALALGALTGLLLRRQLPALGVSLALAVALGQTMDRLRPHLWPTVTGTGEGLPPDAWDIDGNTLAHHPASHFWPIHLVETGTVLTMAALATTAAFTLLRRRTA